MKYVLGAVVGLVIIGGGVYLFAPGVFKLLSPSGKKDTKKSSGDSLLDSIKHDLSGLGKDAGRLGGRELGDYLENNVGGWGGKFLKGLSEDLGGDLGKAAGDEIADLLG
jgi:hypothetical protein